MENLLKEIEALITAGQGLVARERLTALTEKKVPRSLALPLANLSRRSGLAWQGAKILAPLVRADGREPSNATDEERAEYAACLVKIGATDDAIDILRKLDAEKLPEASLYLAFARMTQWDYAAAIPSFEKYLQSKSLTPYQRLVGKVNYAAALVYERHEERARVVLHELLEETSGEAHRLLHGNALELSAIHFITRREFDSALRLLDRASALLGESGTNGEFFVRKWKAIARLGSDPLSAEALAEVRRIRQEGSARRHFETVRDCDHYIALYRGDEALAARVFFGTPFASYRNRMTENIGAPLEGRTTFVWQMDSEVAGTTLIDLPEGAGPEKTAKLKVGKVLHRLLAILSSDFYRPFTVAALHSALYPTEVFNPLSSAHRVQAEIRLLRKWLKDFSVPIEVRHEDGTYRLVALTPCAIRVTVPGQIGHTQIGKLRTTWPKGPFSAREVSELLDVSARSALRILDEGVKQGELVRQGKGPATKYTFPSAVNG